MFGGNRKRRGSSNPPPLNGNNANANATSAAAQAFLRSQASNSSLASAAAGAALRSRPTTPVSIADIQTKRMLRRSGSVSSVGSSVVGSVRPPSRTLERRGSNGSMSERTFRDPSPARGVPAPPDAPPVPALPQHIPKSHRRSSSLEILRVASPPPNKNTGRGSSVGPRPAATTTPPRRSGRSSALPSVTERPALERSESRGSVNFSLPTGSRPTSPMGQRRLTSPEPSRSNAARITSPTNQNLVYDANSRRFLPLEEVLAIEQRIQDATEQEARRKKKAVLTQNTAATNDGGRAAGIAISPMQSIDQLAPVPETHPAATAPVTTPKKKKKKRVVMSEAENEQGAYAEDSPARSLNKKPSMVREEQEEEEETPRATISRDTRPISPSPIPRSASGKAHAKASPKAGGQPVQKSEPLTPTNGKLAPKNSVSGGRMSSVSPARTAHFAVTPDSLSVKHQPPPRSISPKKSALKNSTSPSRANSPLGDMPGTFGSENGSIRGSEDGQLSVPRKKANRVSFDESNISVGEAATLAGTDSPMAPSPQAGKRGWFNMGRKKKDPAMPDEDDDEVMKPRPALPSFGSVRKREQKTEAVEERQLVKPVEHVEPAQVPESEPSTVASTPASPPLFTSGTGEIIEYPLGQSYDQGAGSIIAHDAASKNAANISKSREPLPSQALSADKSGYESDSTISGLGIDNVKKVAPSEVIPSAETESSNENGQIPQINILQATPSLSETAKQKEWPDMPGGFPPGSSVSDSSNSQRPSMDLDSDVDEPIGSTPAIVGIAEPSEIVRPDSPSMHDIIAETQLQHSAIMEETEESDTSVYSDAAEDLSEGEGDGFMSLDAVAVSPVVSTMPGLAFSTPPPDSPTTRTTKEKAYKKSGLSKKTSEPDLETDGWGKVQEYWSSLSAEKKRQLEQEAGDDAEDSDSTIEAKPVSILKKKKQPVDDDEEDDAEFARNERTYMIKPGSKAGADGYTPVLRTSMRAEPPAPEPTIRKSMRGEGSMRGSLRESEKPAAKKRPVSMPVAPTATHARSLSAASAAAAPAAAKRDSAPPVPKMPSLRRKGSADSDSSFKRAKPAEITTFRRSLRAGNAEPEPRPQSPVRSSRFSLRSLSPTGSTAGRRPFNPAPTAQPAMRTSLRGSDSASLRHKSSRTKSPSRLSGFGRSSSLQPVKSKPARSRGSRFAYGSSDEEDEATGPSFSSRFQDSSDDESGPLPQVKGMRSSMRATPPAPRPVTAGSVDLPDSADEQLPELKPGKQRTNGNTPQISTQGSSLAAGTLHRSGSGRDALSPTTSTSITGPATRPQHNRRGSFMSILRRKKDPINKVRKADVESAARRDTPLERSRFDLEALKAGEPPSTPKGQKAPAWPLSVPASPPRILGGENGRPFTADAGDGVVGSEREGSKERPDLGTRRFTATGVQDIDLSGLADKDEKRKKKKFGALRRMFRLDD